MPEQSITNAAGSARVLNVAAGKDASGKPVVEQATVQPGETLDLDVLDPDDPVFKGMVETGDLIVGPKGSKPETEAEKAERLAAQAETEKAQARQEGYQAGYAKGLEDGKAAAKQPPAATPKT